MEIILFNKTTTQSIQQEKIKGIYKILEYLPLSGWHNELILMQLNLWSMFDAKLKGRKLNNEDELFLTLQNGWNLLDVTLLLKLVASIQILSPTDAKRLLIL